MMIRGGCCVASMEKKTRSGSSSSIRAGWYSANAGSFWSRAYSRSQVLRRSRCLIDLTTVGFALSKSMPLMPALKAKTLKLAMEGQIFDEGQGLLAKTVKEYFPSP